VGFPAGEGLYVHVCSHLCCSWAKATWHNQYMDRSPGWTRA